MSDKLKAEEVKTKPKPKSKPVVEEYIIAKGKEITCLRGNLFGGEVVTVRDFGSGKQTVDDFLRLGVIKEK